MVLGKLLIEFESNLARIGAVVSSAALVGYFARAVQVARQQRLMAEDAARRSSQVQKMAAVGQLAGGVAHDFNNKLTAIMGSFDLLREVDDPAEREVILDTARSAALAAARTVKQLMVYARKEIMVPELQDCTALLDETVQHLRDTITGKIRIKLRPSDEPLLVMADRAQLRTGLTNLVANAVDAMPNGGKLVLGAEPVPVGTRILLADGTFLGAGPHVAISVEDTGVGIPARLMPHVVEPFFTTKPVGKGTGLGLSAVLGMAREMGGGLGITSSSRGTRVHIYLPRHSVVSAGDDATDT
jgi:signal transduction histidine kinase